jgi:large subunit ribosomal protein L24
VKVKKGDTVVVIAGKDRGTRGKVLAAIPGTDRVIVEGINRVKRHEKITTSNRGAKAGGITTQEAAVHASNVMVVDSENNATRVGYRRDEETGRNVRISRRGKGKDL